MIFLRINNFNSYRKEKMDSQDLKQQHLAYLKEKGMFDIRIDLSMLSHQQIDFLTQYGHWLEALSNGTLLPFTDLQKVFVEVANKERNPITPEEKAWFTYCFRVEYVKANGFKYSGPRAQLEDNSFTQDGITSPYG